jgi:hypothetical protein
VILKTFIAAVSSPLKAELAGPKVENAATDLLAVIDKQERK